MPLIMNCLRSAPQLPRFLPRRDLARNSDTRPAIFSSGQNYLCSRHSRPAENSFTAVGAQSVDICNQREQRRRFSSVGWIPSDEARLRSMKWRRSAIGSRPFSSTWASSLSSNARLHITPTMVLFDQIIIPSRFCSSAGGGELCDASRKYVPRNWNSQLFRSRQILPHQAIIFPCHKIVPPITCRFYTKSAHRNSVEKNETNKFTNNSESESENPNILDKTNEFSSPSRNTQQTTTLNTSDSAPPTKAQTPPQPQPPSQTLSFLPPSLQPYARLARLDKPIGTFLLLHPCLWSTALATSPLGTHPSPSLCLLFATGAFLMRGAGCTINDMWDSDFDKNVERTKDRPLANGDLNYGQAWKFLALQLTGGLGVLVSLPNLEPCFMWGVASLPLVATYPLMKRYTNYPQLALGMTFNWGAIMGWVAVRGCVDWSVVGPLYASGVAWTLVYDTLYAHQDKRDDKKLGLKSTALTFGEEGTKPVLTALAGITWACWMLAGYNAGYGAVLDNPYFYGGCSLAAIHLLWQIGSADLNDPENLAYRFRSNNYVGGLMFGSCVVGNLMAC
mmetsp:Transcript_14915/g.30010  ORF Transcript_14915/g.30010 Transcript_14915/m.30010 type:complete len:561 (-) Transcript_14915:99-1781(-)